MNRCLIFAFVVCVALARGATAEPPTYKAEPSGKFLKSWLLCGPFPLKSAKQGAADLRHLEGFEKDYLAAAGSEAGAHPAEGDSVALESATLKWTRHTSDKDEIDLAAAISRHDFVAAYVYCEVESDREQACVLALGSNDGARVWLNGEQVWDYPRSRGLKLDEDLIPVILRKGNNRLLLKIEQWSNKWGFASRFSPIDEKLFSKGLRLFDVETTKDGVPMFRAARPDAVIGKIVKSVHLQARPEAEPGRIAWEGDWHQGQPNIIGVDVRRYGEYILNAQLKFSGGASYTAEYTFTAGKRAEYSLFAKGASEYSIVLAESASASERWAADELKHWLKEVSGVDLPIRTSAGAENKAVFVGFNPQVAALLGGNAKAPADTDESFTYENIGPSILIFGGKNRGTMYGVLTFLEREFGLRWYTPKVTVAPRREEYSFDYLRHSESPGIRVRNDFYFEAFDPTWAAHNKMNGAMGYREQPGGIECYWGVHTFYPLVPPEEFFGLHPEYYSLIDGQRTHDRAQLCLTNPDVLKIVTERLAKTMRENPQYLIYDVSQNDWYKPCQCDKCQEIAKREGSESGPILWFVNQVAERVEKEFPDKFVGTLAYQYTRKPPKTLRPRENVIIRLCSIECCFSHDFTSCPQNVEFLSDLRNWAAIAPRLYIWDYVVNFSNYVMPYPNFRVLQPNIKSFRDNHAIGIMEQAAYQSRGGEFAELRMYLISKLLWNPDCNADEVINDFMYGYYGRAGQLVRSYFDLLHSRITPVTHIHLGLKPDDSLFSDEFVREGEKLFDRAEVVAENDDVRRRVEMARLPIMFLKCKRTPERAIADGTYERFTSITEREAVTHFAESGQRDQFNEQMKAIAARMTAAPQSSSTTHPADAPRVKHVKVYFESGRFGGWPANQGIWSWGNEILVGFSRGYYKDLGPGLHAIDRQKPEEHLLARSLDGGETWSIENPAAKGQLIPRGKALHGTELPGVKLPEPQDCPGGIDFTNPDFAMTLRMMDVDTGPSTFSYSYDRGNNWVGPFKVPNFDTPGVAARTNYIIDGKNECLAFLTAAKTNRQEGRSFCARTKDGAKTWEFVSWIGPEPAGLSIMPSGVRISDKDLIVTIRRHEGEDRRWISEYVSHDNGRTWEFVSDPVKDTGEGNPPALIKLTDGRLCLTYGVRAAPFRMCAKLSADGGKTWQPEIVLRSDGAARDMGYPRSVQRPDGKVVTIYYFNDAKTGPERYIGATIWDPGK